MCKQKTYVSPMGFLSDDFLKLVIYGIKPLHVREILIFLYDLH